MKQLEEYFAGRLQRFTIPLSLEGTAFQRSVWRALKAIPYGKTVSYGDISKKIGNPRASRAVGAANGQNPVSIIVPCHRVIGADRTLTGYAGGLQRKAWLLEHEGIAFKSNREYHQSVKQNNRQSDLFDQ